ncbi:MAG: hypothetical protein LAO79_17245, partial [Acidobacteriia bacterium]|nr:hypothetical protein [Terriglobia bacterium]
MRNLAHRMARLEERIAPKRVRRIVLRYEGPGSEKFPQPTLEEMDNNPVITMRFVVAKDGRPVDPMDARDVAFSGSKLNKARARVLQNMWKATNENCRSVPASARITRLGWIGRLF